LKEAKKKCALSQQHIEERRKKFLELRELEHKRELLHSRLKRLRSEYESRQEVLKQEKEKLDNSRSEIPPRQAHVAVLRKQLEQHQLRLARGQRILEREKYESPFICLLSLPTS